MTRRLRDRRNHAVVDPPRSCTPAPLIGDVIVGAVCYSDRAPSLRGDFGAASKSAPAPTEDSCVMHGFPGTDTVVEEDGHIGPRRVLHGCIVPAQWPRRHERRRQRQRGGRRVGNRRRDGVRESGIHRAAAHARRRRPAKVIRALTDTELAGRSRCTQSYGELTRRSLRTMRATAPLSAVDPGRKRLELPELLPLSTAEETAA